MILIVACDSRGGIGNNNKIPWYIPEDLKWFRSITANNVVVMGRKTYESIGKPLSKRINRIVSKTGMSLENALVPLPNKKIFIIGGASIYQQCLKHCDKIYYTMIKKEYVCDTFFHVDFTKYSKKILKETDEYIKILYVRK